MGLESVQCIVNTPLQPDAMPGLEPLFTAEVNKAVFLQMTCEEVIVAVCGDCSFSVAVFSYALSSY